MSTRPERLLVMSCSERKRRFDSPRPAFEVYDGPAFRVVRKYCERANEGRGVRLFARQTKARAAPGLLVMILSAEYGPVPWAAPVEYYERRLLGRVVRPAWCLKLRNFCNVWRPGPAFMYAGEAYRAAVPVMRWGSPGLRLWSSGGRIGEQLSQLKSWLEEES